MLSQREIYLFCKNFGIPGRDVCETYNVHYIKSVDALAAELTMIKNYWAGNMRTKLGYEAELKIGSGRRTFVKMFRAGFGLFKNFFAAEGTFVASYC